MKHLKIKILALAALLLTINISAQLQAGKSATILQPVAKLSSSADTLQYALGAFVGSWLAKNGFTINNPVLFNRGLDDVLQNKPRAVTDSTIIPIVAAYQLSTQNERSRQLEAQLFATLKSQTGVGALPDGVYYIIVKGAAGMRPMATDTIVFNAIGVLADGTVFEDTYQKKEPIINITGNLIPGLSEAVQLMPVGSTWRIFVPSALAYGPKGLPNLIPPYSALVFDITLEKVKK